jgi:hypothetical protein
MAQRDGGREVASGGRRRVTLLAPLVTSVCELLGGAR